MSIHLGAHLSVTSGLARLAEGHVDDAVLELVLAVLRSEPRPISLPGLCNRLWFEQGRAGGYDGPACDSLLADVPTFAHGIVDGERTVEPQPAVPLGAIVKVEVGNNIAYGEIVWKEGAHPLLDPAWVPGWLAGAPSGAPLTGPPPADFVPPAGDRTLRERLVVDFACLGESLAPTEKKLERIRSRGRRLDRFGHLIADVSYADGLDEADEVSFWAAWTAAHQPNALRAAGVEPDAAVLSEAVSVLAAALDGVEDLRSFGPHFMSAERYAELVATDDADYQGLRRTVRGLARVSPRESVSWASMSARLVETCPTDMLMGTAWPRTVAAASLLALDTLALEAPDGDWQGVHLRLDDSWQGGGLWRAERLDRTSPVDADAAVALGLGWVAHTGGEIKGIPDEDPASPDQVKAPSWFDDEDEELEWTVTGSDATWLVHLSAADIDTDRLRLPGPVSNIFRESLFVRNQSQALVVLQHDGQAELRQWASLGGDGHLEFQWPLGFLPGTTARMSWQVQATVLSASTTLLPTPEEVAGLLYTHVFNLALALAAAGARESGSRTVTVRELVRAAVRRHGDVTEDGCFALTVDGVLERCFGPEGEVVPGFGRDVLRRAVIIAANGLAATRAARIDGEFIVVSPRLTEAGRRADAELLAKFVDAGRQRLRRSAQRHWVPATVVNLPWDWERSAEKDSEWQQVAGTEGLPAGELGPHQTWRRAHARGHGMSAAVLADLERLKAAALRLGVTDAGPDLDAVVADPYGPDSGHHGAVTDGQAASPDSPHESGAPR